MMQYSIKQLKEDFKLSNKEIIEVFLRCDDAHIYVEGEFEVLFPELEETIKQIIEEQCK